MWIVLFFIVLQSNAAPSVETPTAPPTIVVQAVDSHHRAIGAATVTVRPLASNAQSISVRADDEGYAKFFVPDDADYSIEVKMPFFKTARFKELDLSKGGLGSHTAYIQLVMKFAPHDKVTVD